MGWDVWVVLAASSLALQLFTIGLRREWREQLPYVGMLLLDLALLSFAHATHRDDGVLGVVTTSLALVLVVGPRVADNVERRMLARDELRWALRALQLHELLVPGRASTRRRRQLHNLVEARAGGATPVLRRLRAELDGERDADAAAMLHEEVATVCFMAQRFAEGVTEAERYLPADWAASHPGFAAYLVRAYGELGHVDRALATLLMLESGPARRDPAALALLTQARLTVLALAGRAPDVDQLLVGAPGLFVSPRAKRYLHDTAHARASLWNVSAAPSNPETADEAEDLDRATDASKKEPEQAAVARLHVAKLLDGVAARAGEAVQPLARPRSRPRVTLALVVANLAVAIAVTGAAAAPSTSTLIRAGALFRPAVQAGEWWRAFTAMFLHGDWVHLGLNMYVLYLLGRFAEEVLGPLRFFVIYIAGGLAGWVASTYALQQAGLSIGASGAIMGLLGAIIVLLIVRRRTWPEAWRRTLLWTMLVVGALQIYAGLQLPIMDNAAHMGGLVGGAVAALLVAPGGLIGRSLPARVLIVGLAVAALVGLGWSVDEMARTSLPMTFAKLPAKEVTIRGQQVRVPQYWDYDAAHDVASDPYLGVQLGGAPGASLTAEGRGLVAGSAEAAPPIAPDVVEALDHVAKSGRAP